MATTGIVKSWVVPADYKTDQNALYGGAYFSWEWTSSKKSSGVTTVSWELYGKGRSSSPNNLKNSCKVEMVYGNTTTTLYNMAWGSTSQDTDTGENTCFNGSKDNSLRASGSFDITHDTDGDASFTINMTVAIWSSTTHSNSNVVTLDSNPHSYTVTFDANTGSVSTESKTVTNGSTYGTLPTPTKTGYKFNGWYTASSGGNNVVSSTTVSLSANQTLYAQWTPYVLSLTYHANNGTYTADSYAGTTTFTYKANYDEGCSANSTLYNIQTFGATRTGYHVNDGAEWNNKADGSGTSFDHDTNYGTAQAFAYKLGMDLSKGDQSATIYVNWKPNTLTINYNSNGGTFTKGDSTSISGNYDSSYGNDGSVADIDNTFGAKLIGYHVNDGYEWNTKSDGSGITINDATQYANTQDLATAIGVSIDSKDQTVTLYANWKVNIYNISYDSGGSDVPGHNVTHGVTTPLDTEIPTRTGYTFTHWSSEVGTIDGNAITVNDDLQNGEVIVLRGNWRVNKGVIYFHPNGGHVVTTKYDHTLDNDMSSLTQEFDYENPCVQVYKTTDLFLKDYHYVKYNATAWMSLNPEYNSDGELVVPQWVANSSENTPLDTEDYQDFVNQSKETDFHWYVEDGDCEIHLYVNWVPTYLEINYLLTSADTGVVMNGHVEQYKYDEQVIKLNPEELWVTDFYTYDVGHHTAEIPWVTYHDNIPVDVNVYPIANDLANYLFNDNTALLSQPKNVSAKINWEANQYIIIYNSDGGSAIANTTATYNTPSRLSNTIPAKDGYIFAGWNLNGDGYNAGSPITIIDDLPNNTEIILVALWKRSDLETTGSTCFIKVNGVWKQGQVFSKDVTWKNATIFRKTDNVYR